LPGSGRESDRDADLTAGYAAARPREHRGCLPTAALGAGNPLILANDAIDD